MKILTAGLWNDRYMLLRNDSIRQRQQPLMILFMISRIEKAMFKWVQQVPH